MLFSSAEQSVTAVTAVTASSGMIFTLYAPTRSDRHRLLFQIDVSPPLQGTSPSSVSSRRTSVISLRRTRPSASGSREVAGAVRRQYIQCCSPESPRPGRAAAVEGFRRETRSSPSGAMRSGGSPASSASRLSRVSTEHHFVPSSSPTLLQNPRSV